MHKSEELLDAGTLLYKELSKLGISSLSSGYGLMSEDQKYVTYYVTDPSTGETMPIPMATPHTETKEMRLIGENWKKQEPFLTQELTAQETIAHQTFIAERSTNFQYSAAELLTLSPERLVLHNFNFKQGYLLIVWKFKIRLNNFIVFFQ